MYSNQEIIGLHAKALSNIAHLLNLSKLGFPKVKLSHQKLLEFVARVYGFNSYKSAIEKEGPLHFNGDVFPKEFFALLNITEETPRKHGLQELRSYFRNYLRVEGNPENPILNDLAEIFSHLHFTYKNFTLEAQNIIALHSPREPRSEPHLLELYLFCHIITTRDLSSDRPHWVFPFKASTEKRIELNELLEFHLGCLMKTTPDRLNLQLQSNIVDILEDEYSIVLPNSALSVHPSYFSFVELLGHSSTLTKEKFIDKQLMVLTKEKMVRFNDFKVNSGDEIASLVKIDFNRMVYRGLCDINSQIFRNIKNPLFYHVSVFFYQSNYFSSLLHERFDIDQPFNFYVNSSGFLKIESSNDIDDLLLNELGLDANDLSYAFCILTSDYMLNVKSNEREKEFYAIYEDYLFSIVGEMIEKGVGLNNPDGVRSFIKKFWGFDTALLVKYKILN